MTCPRCWRIVGESLRCLDHGGESAFTAGAHTHQPKPVVMPPEAMYDYLHEFWAFLDVVPVDKRGRKHRIVEDVIP